MAKLPREKALRALRGAGAENDRRTWTRLYVENRISLQVAQQCWREGQQLAAFVAARDKLADA